ncbi:MAG: chromosome segregation protein SMC [Micavibrio aeruginosavorus]|uniref:Chromosome partition protein Smc n=1 Tax=Micavibrio aeruginosavorus TaxID=349221 RepID=A0A2W5PP07_9BACT|nr:MAG: chromosome segregation protein SMC [Micavibrio aeruginosavorus]
MIQFEKIRLSGFKSFVDKTEFEIGPGLTGIVGPNGCGKSNTVEALRWVMGENSAKRMRGGTGGMEDVIFAGTSSRPARNFAEVSLLLNNASRTAPAAYNDSDEIEVTRRIERDHGSLYKINGKVCRARDVQMLFADTVTGANSPAMVSQGRVTAMINAKPQERRIVLEESAGVSGLYVRRHEAELRLRAADQNLQRVQDLVGSMEGRYNTLKKQTRQAQKYKNLSTQIRELEITIAYLEWRLQVNRVDAARKSFAEAESHVATHMATVVQLTRTQNQQAEDLPPLRKAEAEAAAALQAHKMELQRLEDRERDLKNQLDESTAQLKQTVADREHEVQILSESQNVLERLEEEQRILSESRRNEESDLTQKQQIKAELEAKVLKLEADYESFMQKTAETRAARQRIEQLINADQSRMLVAEERKEKLADDLSRAKAQFENDAEVDELKSSIVSLEGETGGLRSVLENAENNIAMAREQLELARQAKAEAERRKSEIDSEVKALERIINADTQSLFKPVLEDIKTDKGFEKAISRALGDMLMASKDKEAPSVFLDFAEEKIEAPSLPSETRKLEPHVQAPSYLKRALEFIAVVDTQDQGDSIAAQLKPGQSIVSLDGAYWRWDGLHIKANASDRHAIQLQQKNRLEELTREKPDVEWQYLESTDKANAAHEFQREVQGKFDSVRSELRGKEQDLQSRQSRLNRLTEQRSGLFAEIAKYEESLKRTEEDIVGYRENIVAHKEELATYNEDTMAAHAAEVEQLRGVLSEARDSYNHAVRALDQMTQEQGRRMARMHVIADERNHHTNRSIRSRERLKDLEERELSLKERVAEMESRPQVMDDSREGLMNNIGTFEKARDEAADNLAKVESELAITTRALKEAENILTEAREARAHAQALVSSGQELLETISNGVIEQFDQQPQDLKSGATVADFSDEDALPALDPLKSQKEKFVRERDQIGPVNLQAEEEAGSLEAELGTIFKERDDLTQAIEELREGINKLNKEARERLTAAFDIVNGHFKELFVKLFNGGQAHLQLIESDDPLQSGLEIFAQPPGKTLQSLSLLSGGEQTLASIALIFAMFLTTPSPICVLDEIDAPLDDANVDRVCNLLDDLAARGQTRFLVITHHRLTMARMDRLYGVTMSERGVSQLVSVDLNKQMDFLEAAE